MNDLFWWAMLVLAGMAWAVVYAHRRHSGPVPGGESEAWLTCPDCRGQFTCDRSVAAIEAAKVLHREYLCTALRKAS